MSTHPEKESFVLGIESSCDDTGVAIVKQNGQILSNCIHSQLKRHLAHGGIIPVVAKEYHLQNIDHVAREAFQQSRLTSVGENVDAIAVSNRPGLIFSLQVGLNYSRTLAKKYSKPLIPIHHMQAHALMPTLQNPTIRFPFMALLISGGHCILAIARRFDDFHILGNTTDDAPGDLLDKFARRMRLRNLGPPYDSLSGGASIELLSKLDNADRFRYFNTEHSIPMLKKQNCDFSFAGYRGTYELMVPKWDKLWQQGPRSELLKELSDSCASIQRAILIQLVKKLQRAVLFYRMHWRYNNREAFANENNTTHLGYQLHQLDVDMDEQPLDLLVSGGVAANSYMIEGIKIACDELFDHSVKVHAPAKNLCSDNGLMVAWNGMLHYRNWLDSRGLKDSVVCRSADEMDQIEVKTQCPMGLQIGNQVEAANFRLARLQHSEFKLENKCK